MIRLKDDEQQYRDHNIRSAILLKLINCRRRLISLSVYGLNEIHCLLWISLASVSTRNNM